MSRNLPAPILSGIQSQYIAPAIMADLTFATSTQYVWTGPKTLTWNGHNYLGVGSLGTVNSINEGVEVRADGTTIALSGIDPVLLNESLTDIQVGAPAILYFALVDSTLSLLGVPYIIFRGKVDKPTVTPGLNTITISLALESPLTNLQRPNMRRYTATDQRQYYPDDTSMNWVEMLNDIALRWGM